MRNNEIIARTYYVILVGTHVCILSVFIGRSWRHASLSLFSPSSPSLFSGETRENYKILRLVSHNTRAPCVNKLALLISSVARTLSQPILARHVSSACENYHNRSLICNNIPARYNIHRDFSRTVNASIRRTNRRALKGRGARGHRERR